MNKRGQFYIIIAIIISLSLVAITTKINKIKEPILFEDFSDLSSNYITESRHVVNHALYSKNTGPGIRTDVDDFTISFVELVRENVNPTLQILYVYSNGTNLTVGNHFNTSVNLENSTLLGAQQELVEEIKLNVGGIDFINQVPVKAASLGQEWYTITSPKGSVIKLSIGGIVHSFKIDQNSPQLKAIVRTTSSGPQTFLTIGGNASQKPDIKFSPQQPNQVVQQSIYDG